MFRKPVFAALALGAVALGAFAAPAPALADAGVRTGLLNCAVAGGWGYVLGSSRKISCTYIDTGGNRLEHYTGRISKLGLDIGYVTSSSLVWAVFTPTTDSVPGALDGSYVGATAGATVGLGGDLNALIGGGSNSISLQPLSMTGNKGLNLAAGMESLLLKYQPLFPNIQ